jgi:PAS domain S-box-containing protein
MQGEIRVLCVDDDAAFAGVVAAALERLHEGFATETARTAEAGIERLRTGDHDIDCVVSDYDMPDVDGIEFLEAIRDAGVDIPFLLYTAKGSEDVAERAISAGVADYVQKGDGAEQFAVLAQRVRNAVHGYRSRQALEESEERFRAMVEASRDAIFVYDENEQFRYVNDRAAEMTGYSTDELLEMSMWTVVHPDDKDRLRERVAARFRGEDVSNEFEAKFVTASGAVRELDLSARTISRDGDVVGFVAARDVTDERRRQRELEAQNRRLEEFAGMLSHDLRSPLTVASGRLELARQRGEDEDFEGAAAALERMETLIEDMLALARHGSSVDETETISLEQAARLAWSDIRTPESTLEVEGGTVEAAPERLRQLLENLLGNAIEHGGKDVTVRVGTLDGGGFYVEDDGEGIPGDEVERVFERGFTTAEDGVGWGLVVVEQIAAAHGWSVRVTESRSGGARFEVGENVPQSSPVVGDVAAN